MMEVMREKHGRAVTVVLLGLFCAAPLKVIRVAWNLIWTSLGTAVGVGLGLGLAMHVYEQLQQWQKDHDWQKGLANGVRRVQTDSTLPRSASRQTSNMLEDGTSYSSLMESAGYAIDDKVLRGQVLREDASFWKNKYRFTDVSIRNQIGPRMLQEDWPGLPPSVAQELGRFVEHVMRDFIATWYSRIDGGCVHSDEKEKRQAGIPRDGGDWQGGSGTNQEAESPPNLENDVRRERHDTGDGSHEAAPRNVRKMVFSTLTRRRIPMLDQTYRILSVAFGNLATRAEHVNVFSLALLKWTQVLAHTLKVYRHLRTQAQEKNETEHPSETEVTREFLLAGKLHKAVTFGLDVPSLLFADSCGREFGTGTSVPPLNPEQVLEQRLFNTAMLNECELDYNRVVAHRLVRALLPRSDSSAQVVLALVVEIFARFVLQPLMNLFIPSFLNGLVVSKLKKAPGESDTMPNEIIPGSDAPLGEQKPQQHLEDSGAPPLENKDVKWRPNPDIVPDGNGLPGRARKDGLTESSTELRNEPTCVQERDVDQQLTTKPSGSLSSNSSGIAVTGTSSAFQHAVAALLESLDQYLDFDDHRAGQAQPSQHVGIWENKGCQQTVLRLLLVIEAVLLNGRCTYRECVDIGEDEIVDMKDDSFIHLLMEMTSDMGAFARRIEAMKRDCMNMQISSVYTTIDFAPENNEVSTLRTLISTWMHSGNVFKAISLIISGQSTIFAHFYDDETFLKDAVEAKEFLGMLKVLDGVDIVVDTTTVMSSPMFDPSLMDFDATTSDSIPNNEEMRKEEQPPETRKSFSGWQLEDLPLNNDTITNFGNIPTPRYLDFHKNSAFASSLRAERERRMRSWEIQPVDEMIQTVCRASAPLLDLELHNELHNLSRLFYNGTNIMTIRDAARKNESDDADFTPNKGAQEQEKVSLLTVEMVSNRRRIEVPDDDSSFLLRAQPRALNPVSIHRDDRNADLSYKCFLATYEEPAISVGSNRYSGGRYIRRCFMQYYPIDRTATIMLHNDARRLDRRKGRKTSPDRTQQNHQTTANFFSGRFLRDRHLCQKWTSKGVSTQSFLSSTVMEAADFAAIPRNGRALDFVYRMSLFERPTVDLSGKRFTIQDSSARGAHRADASSLEISDAALSTLLYTVGRDYDDGNGRAVDNSKERSMSTSEGVSRHKVEMGPDGYPMVFLKFNRRAGDQISREIKPYRLSFVRAALLVTSARQEAQLQCLVDCVRVGSPKSATKSRTEARLKPTLKILEFANDQTADLSRASILLRDLKLGVYHIDREQIRRNGLLNPRSPTTLLEFEARVEGAVQGKEVPDVIRGNAPPTSTLYRIRCIAIVTLASHETESGDCKPYVLDDGTIAGSYREEWVVFRSMKDFQQLHKQLKSEVATSESSASTGSRLVGAATAAFSTYNPGRRSRKALVPSLAQASKTGAIAATKKALHKRGELLDDYLSYLLSSGHPLSRCAELLLFLGASYPFPPEVSLSGTPANLIDPFGRLEFTRTTNGEKEVNGRVVRDLSGCLGEEATPETNRNLQAEGHPQNEWTDQMSALHVLDMKASILNKVDQVPLAEVRNRLVELVRYQFGFENASFFRSRMLAALETVSFVAITKASDFRKMLYDSHEKKLNPDSIASLIRKVIDVLWPDGVWLTAPPPLSADEEADLRERSRTKLHESFPDQIRAILGQELTSDGLDIVHEMLQNRIVVKSLFYMFFDILWIEIFPELRDALTCASALNID